MTRASTIETAASAILAVVLIVLGVAFGRTSRDAEDPRPSTFLDSRHGLRALFLILSEVGADPSRAQVPAAGADPADRTLVVVAPTEPFTRRETREIQAWVRSGGRLVVAAVGGVPASFGAAHGLLEGFGLALRLGAGREIAYPADWLGSGLGHVELSTRWSLAPGEKRPGDAGEPENLVTAGESALALRQPFGTRGGEVVAIADATFLANDRLRRGDGALLAVRLLLGRASDGGRVVFDEFHHGFATGDGTGDIAGALAGAAVSTWPGRAALVLIAAGLLVLSAAAVRLGAPERDRPPPRRALAEHADALGRLFETARARREALQILAAGARRHVGPRSGVPAALPPAEFVRRLRTSAAPGAEALAHAIERAEAGGAMRDSDLAAAAAALAESKRRFLHGGG